MTVVKTLGTFQPCIWVYCLILIAATPSFGREFSPISSSAKDKCSVCPTHSIPSTIISQAHKDDQLPSKSQPPAISQHHQPNYGPSAPPSPIASDHHHSKQDYYSSFPSPPPPPKEVPLRFLNACNGDYAEAQSRYEATLEWRREEQIDTILREPFPNFFTIKEHYPHYYHGTGFRGEPVYYEFPAKADMKALKREGLSMDQLLRHYNMITEFQWQMLNRDDSMTSIFIVDLEGITLGDFVGEAVDLVKKASKVSAEHYPERAGLVFIVNVPRWFKLIWKVIVTLVPEETLEKIFVLRGTSEILSTLSKYVPMENIPAEYGGTSPQPLGQSSEESLLADLMRCNLHMTGTDDSGDSSNQGVADSAVHMTQQSNRFCNWVPARSY
ncbi:MAG: hypothetical protein SGBAC_000857 [Bacillariaceae sp.]